MCWACLPIHQLILQCHLPSVFHIGTDPTYWAVRPLPDTLVTAVMKSNNCEMATLKTLLYKWIN